MSTLLFIYCILPEIVYIRQISETVKNVRIYVVSSNKSRLANDLIKRIGNRETVKLIFKSHYCRYALLNKRHVIKCF